MVGATVALDEGHPGAGVGFECGELGEVEGVVDLAGYGLGGGMAFLLWSQSGMRERQGGFWGELEGFGVG